MGVCMSKSTNKLLLEIISGVVVAAGLSIGIKSLFLKSPEHNKEEFDVNGFTKSGYDKNGYNAEGYNKDGYGKDGYNFKGIDRYGYNKNKYNLSGFDRVGYNCEFYQNELERLSKRLNDAYQQMQDGKFRYAIYDSRVILEGTLKLIVHHSRGQENDNSQIVEFLKICEEDDLLGENIELLDKLHEVRRISNKNGHEYDSDEFLTLKKTYFVIMQIRELLSIAKKELAC